MPWVETEFQAEADGRGLFQGKSTVDAPVSGRLREYKVATTTGCRSRAHSTQLVIQRVDDPSDKLDLQITLRDCEEHQEDINPPFRVRGGRSYVIHLTSDGFEPGEQIEGKAAVLYTLFFDLQRDTTS